MTLVSSRAGLRTGLRRAHDEPPPGNTLTALQRGLALMPGIALPTAGHPPLGRWLVAMPAEGQFDVVRPPERLCAASPLFGGEFALGVRLALPLGNERVLGGVHVGRALLRWRPGPAPQSPDPGQVAALPLGRSVVRHDAQHL